MKIITRERNVLLVNLQPDIWTSVDAQVSSFSDDIFALTGGLYRYVAVNSFTINDYRFSNDKIFQEFDLHTPIRDRVADEVWVFGTEFSDVSMGGLRPFWIGEQPIKNTESVYRRFPVLRFGSLDSMLRVYARRIENTLYYVYRGYPPAKNMWEKFIRTERSHPGRAACGSVIYPPHGIMEKYDGPGFFSNCDSWWQDYPAVQDNPRYVAPEEWGKTRDGYLKWWMRHLPHGVHKTDGIHDNWWHYVMNLDLVK